MSVRKPSIETEVVPYYKLNLKKRRELAPLFNGYLKELKIRNTAERELKGLAGCNVHMVVVKYNNKPIGYSYYTNANKKKPLLGATYVSPEFRKLGISDKLTAKRLYLLRMRGYNSFSPNLTITPGGKRVKEKRANKWLWVQRISQSVFNRAVYGRRK